MEISVAQAAEQLGVDRSRVQQLLRSGGLPGRRLGRDWLVDEAAVRRLVAQPHRAGRPMAPARAWGLLDLLDGGDAPWLAAVARSQVRAQLKSLVGADAGRWRAILRARADVRAIRAHPSVLERLVGDPEALVLSAGPQRAVAAGVDLVVVDPAPEIYVRAADWASLARRWHLREVDTEPNLVVRMPRGIEWPFAGRGEVGPAALAADLLESAESRAVAAGLARLKVLVAERVGP